MTNPTLLKAAVEALNSRLAELTPQATPEQLAYLSKSVQNMAGQGTILDIVALTDDKLKELLDAAITHLSDINNAEIDALSSIDTAQKGALNKIDTSKKDALSDMLSNKNAHILSMSKTKTSHIAEIKNEGSSQLKSFTSLVDKFSSVNDVPDDSSIMNEITLAQKGLQASTQNTLALHPNSLPFIFGVLSRSQDRSDGKGDFTTQLGQWRNGNGDNILRLLSGANSWGADFISFHRHPQLHFLQGDKGSFVYRELHNNYRASNTQLQYPYALIGVFFIKNTTDSDISQNFHYGGSSSWRSGYEGASIHIGIPNDTNANKDNISSISWNNVYSYSASTSDFGYKATTITIPAGKTVALIFYTSSYSFNSDSNWHGFFMHWYVYNFRSHFLTNGLEIDFDLTMKAWMKGGGISDTYQLWN